LEIGAHRKFEMNFAAKEKLEIVSGAAPPPFRIFAGGFPRRLRRRNAFGLIQEYCTINGLYTYHYEIAPYGIMNP
jgi:hypothetical protein